MRVVHHARGLIRAFLAGFLAVSGVVAADQAQPSPTVHPLSPEAISERLQAGYPGIVAGVEGLDLIFADKTKLPLDDGRPNKSAGDLVDKPDIEDMFRQPYEPGPLGQPPPEDWDPGRARNEAFFLKVYGDCRKHEVEPHLVDVVWLPKKYGHKLKATKINGVADRLRAISVELDALPKKFDVDLYPSAGTYNCRVVAGTRALSAHGFGIAIDIALKHSSYWRWFLAKSNGKADLKSGGKDAGKVARYRNAIPMEIVRIFERHGFIWGGKWRHFDTMHFEYRPELLPVAAPDNANLGPAKAAVPALAK